MRYLFPPTLKTVRSPTKDAGANIAFRSLGLRHPADSIASAQRHKASAAFGSRSMKSRIRLSDTILTPQVPISGTTPSSGVIIGSSRGDERDEREFWMLTLYANR